MSVAAHLHIRLADYDRRVRTFIPAYEELLDATAALCGPVLAARTGSALIDLGIGTGALAARCLTAAPSASLVGIDSDPAMLRVAMRRFARRRNPVTLIHADLARCALPPADAIAATLALHHVRTRADKLAVFRRCFKALRPGGIIASGDCHPSAVRTIAARQMERWMAHMRTSYSAGETRRFLEAWAGEDNYMPLGDELVLLARAGFTVDVAWRRDAFAVVVGAKP